MAEKEKSKAPVEITIRRDEPPSETHYEDGPVMIVHIGSHFIETTVALEESAVGAWVRSAVSELRLFRGGGTTVVSICAFRGLGWGSSWKGPLSHPNHPSNPYRAIAICVGGCRVLFYELDDWDRRKDPGRIFPLRDLLNNRKVVVVGWGIAEMVKKLDSEWGLKIARAVDVRNIAAGTYGKDAIWWPKLEKGKVVRKDVGLEGLAEFALDGMQLEKKPTRVREANWSNMGISGWFDDDDPEDVELIKYATRDAVVTHMIATKCIKKSGLPQE
ncbi:Werner Syndrome-like exonuclease [Rhynchospora pubera]|uniref:Werner Syndrome-like exonuclease n=1 Tax=Rhynchospora pubera TaxID=906938 RepID=A0AAV8G0E8_9POAL|nr:Werner Syndrome-like exonuclease [Rhynchospora pubera]